MSTALHASSERSSVSNRGEVSRLLRGRDALKNHTPRQLRLMFALHAWHKPMVYDGNALKGALDTEATLRNFFRTTNALLRPRKLDGIASIARWQVSLKAKNLAVGPAADYLQVLFV